MDVQDKVVIVTGASEGIGLETARLLAKRGAKLVLAARNEEKLTAIAAELPGAIAVPTDMRADADIKDLVHQTIEHFGRVDILINNAGQAVYGKIEAVSPVDYRSILELNVVAPFIAMQEVIPHMRKQGGGMILNVSSGTSKMVLPNAGTYASTKAALNMLTLVARKELEKDNIVVSVIYPYITATNFGQNAKGQMFRPVGTTPNTMPEPHSAEFVALKILEQIESGEAELGLYPQR